MEAHMIDFLFLAGQVFCIAGLLYGAYRSITYCPDDEVDGRPAIGHEPLTTKVWRIQRESIAHRMRRTA
jgi:hypothetical protein